MATLSDEKIKQAYEDVRANKSETTYLLLDYESDKSNNLILTSTGTGPISDLAAELQDDRASFAYVRVKYAIDEQSFREKFVLVIWIGSGVKVMRRAKVSVHAADVKRTLSAYSTEVNASSKADLDEKTIVDKLKKAGGASYDGK